MQKIPDTWQTLITNVNLVTMTNGTSDYSIVKEGALAIRDGKIAWLGKCADVPTTFPEHVEVIDGQDKWLTPGFVDCHTHIVYGGNRANEFEMRLQGASYEEIAKAGGGIVSTVAATRAATEAELLTSALKRASALQQQGVTTLEIKSGYGLDIENEIKMLKVATQVAEKLPLTVKRTFLGAHALPVEFKDRPDDYISLVCDEMLPKAYEQGLVDAVDVFCEGIGFSLEQTKKVFDAATELSLPIKVHAEQLSDLGGSVLAASYQALSSDHLEYLSEEGVKAMKSSDTVAVLLPGAFYFLRETKLPPIDLLRKHGVKIAVATDCNPGSSPIASLQLMLNMACTLFRLTPVEALAGVTTHAAKALGYSDRGQLSIGKKADIAIWDISQPAELCYQFGVNSLVSSYKDGVKVSLNN